MNSNNTTNGDKSTTYLLTPPIFSRETMALVSSNEHGGRQKKVNGRSEEDMVSDIRNF